MKSWWKLPPRKVGAVSLSSNAQALVEDTEALDDPFSGPEQNPGR